MRRYSKPLSAIAASKYEHGAEFVITYSFALGSILFLPGRDTEPYRRRARMRARLDVELPEYRRHVVGDGSLGEEELPRDVRVAEALGHQRENLDLARSEV